jgi:hypothetical protein
MGKSDLVQKVGGPIHCWSRGPKTWGPVPPPGGCAYVSVIPKDLFSIISA